jgi:antibiotic biosynthesis monooxygenase (ABM) superfamily enzyme
MAAIGMSILAAFAPTWPPILRALALTVVVVPTAVYVVVPRLLLLRSKILNARHRSRQLRSRAASASTHTN